jgi:hypothetical protein
MASSRCSGSDLGSVRGRSLVGCIVVRAGSSAARRSLGRGHQRGGTSGMERAKARVGTVRGLRSRERECLELANSSGRPCPIEREVAGESAQAAGTRLHRYVGRVLIVVIVRRDRVGCFGAIEGLRGEGRFPGFAVSREMLLEMKVRCRGGKQENEAEPRHESPVCRDGPIHEKPNSTSSRGPASGPRDRADLPHLRATCQRNT